MSAESFAAVSVLAASLLRTSPRSCCMFSSIACFEQISVSCPGRIHHNCVSRLVLGPA